MSEICAILPKNTASRAEPPCVKLVNGRVGGGGYAWTLLSGLTLFVSNLVGLPFAYANASMQLEISILDTQDVLVGRYTLDYHREWVPVALYYGYGSDAALKVAVDTFKACMTDIKAQIELDFNRLNGALETSTPLLRSPGSGTSVAGSSRSSSRAGSSESSGATGEEPSLRENW